MEISGSPETAHYSKETDANNNHTGSNVVAEELVEAGVDIEEAAVSSILEVNEMKRRMLVVFVQKLKLDHKVVLKLIIVLIVLSGYLIVAALIIS
ncbi:hypothetical protein QE152_g29528 [Popillia japonica]|uniref:Uncharacterized protein n=1 Tax=Popillia japonica TaxID=7064 RepID=A0AAW1JHW3_POPJA